MPDITWSLGMPDITWDFWLWLSGEAALAGRENHGDLWDLASGLDLQLPIVCAGFRTLSLASVQNLGCWNACSKKLALDRAWSGEWGTMCLKRGFASSNWLIRVSEGLVELSTEMIQSLACVNVTPQSNSQRAKQRGHIKTFQRYFRDILIH